LLPIMSLSLIFYGMSWKRISFRGPGDLVLH